MCTSHLRACPVRISQQEKRLVTSCALRKESWDKVSSLHPMLLTFLWAYKLSSLVRNKLPVVCSDSVCTDMLSLRDCREWTSRQGTRSPPPPPNSTPILPSVLLLVHARWAEVGSSVKERPYMSNKSNGDISKCEIRDDATATQS